MPDPQYGGIRLARAGMVNAGVFALATGAHFVAGGSLPEPLVLFLLGVFVQLGCVAVVRRLSFPAVLAALSTGQVVLHLAYEAAAAGSGRGAGGSLATSVGDHTGAAGSPPAGPVGHGAQLEHDSVVMFAGHTVATIISALLLIHGDRAFQHLLRYTAPAIVFRVPVLNCRARFRRVRVTATGPLLPASPRISSDTASRRGPPRSPVHDTGCAQTSAVPMSGTAC